MKNIVDIFQVLGNSVRYKIVDILLKEKRRDPKSCGMCVCDLIKECGIANSTMTHHLDWLKSVSLLTSRKEGQWIYYDIDMDTVKKIKEYVAEKM